MTSEQSIADSLITYILHYKYIYGIPLVLWMILKVFYYCFEIFICLLFFFNSIFVVLLVDRFLLLLLFRKGQNFSKDNFNAQFLRLLSIASVKCAFEPH